MDKDWVKLDRNCPQYRLALSNFIDNSIRVAGHDGDIKCPCKKCYNTSWEMPETVRKHMIVYGMWNAYQNGVWREHGEPLQQHNNPTGFPNVPPVEINVPDCGMLDMLNDAFHEEHTSVNSDVEPDPLSEPTPEAANFFNLLKEADMDIYPGCTRMKKLDFLVHAFKIKCLYKVSDVALTEFLLLFKSILPKGETLPKSFYLARKLISDLGLNYEKIDACPNDCMIYWKDRASFLFCPDCGESRYKNNKSPNSTGKECKVPQKVLRYFPLAPRLQRLYMNHQTSKEMTWHATDRPTDGVMRHPADSPAWQHLDNKFPVFSNEIRNVRLGLASDGFNPFGNMSNAHSTWPVVLSVYNLAPWLCMKRPYLILSLLIPGPRGPGKDIDVYLEPLVDELKKLWEDGITSYDAYRKQQFTLRAAILWTISDFPAYAMLSGWSTKGKLACPNCNHGTCSKWLNHGHKYCYMGHRRFLPNGHPFRQEAELFDNTIELREAPVPLTGTECLEELSDLTFRFGKGKPPPQQKNKNKRKRSAAESSGGKKICLPWKQKSIFFDLPYWEHLLLRHNLDVMHIEKNVFDSVLGTILGIPRKSKDSLNARLDMEEWNIRKDLHPVRLTHKMELQSAMYTMSLEEKTLFCTLLAFARLPDGMASNIARCVHVKERKLIGLKSHDCHIIMQQLLPLAIRNTLPESVIKVLLELSAYFRHLCSKTGTIESFERLSDKIVIILCELEKIFPPAFFDVMVHLPVHLAREAAIAGPVHYRWMYPIESYLGDLKDYVRNPSKPEGSIAEGYIVDECMSFCSLYLKDTETRRNRFGRNTDAGGRDVLGGLSIFGAGGRPLGKGDGEVVLLDEKELNLAHACVLHNCTQVQALLDKHIEDAKARRGKRVTLKNAEKAARAGFGKWFEDYVKGLNVDRNNNYTEDLRALGKGPSEWCLRHKKYIINGFRFRVKSIDNQGSNQNSGVFVTMKAPCYSSARDLNPIDGEVDYYGVVTDIIELSYDAGRKVVLFRGDWVDSLVMGNGIKTDAYGFTLVNFSRLLQQNDPFILASQAMQVFYVQDPSDIDWHLVVKTRPRDFYDMGTDPIQDPCSAQELGNSQDGDACEYVRTDIPSFVIHVAEQIYSANHANTSNAV